VSVEFFRNNAHYWPWWLGGLALAGVAVGFWQIVGRLLGVSGSFAAALRPGDSGVGGGVEASLAAVYAARPRPAWSAHVTLLVAMLLGGALGALSRGSFQVRTDLGPDYAALFGAGWRMWATLIGGGLLVGFGTSMAGGCTSGHGLCGTSRLQRGSLAATVSFFGAAVAFSLLLDAVIR